MHSEGCGPVRFVGLVKPGCITSKAINGRIQREVNPIHSQYDTHTILPPTQLRLLGHLGSRHGENTTPKESAWDHVLRDIEVPPRDISSYSPRLPRSQRQTMSAREINAFDEMFSMIFDAHSAKKTTASPTSFDPSFSDIFGRLRKQSRMARWTSEQDVELDKMKEAMNMCRTDNELLQWALREVFGEVKPDAPAVPTANANTESQEATTEQSSEGAPTTSPEPAQKIRSPAYPHLIAILMRTFREKYKNPHLALAIFDHARNLSITSFVFGCTTRAYNELIETRWSYLHDLKGVFDTLMEMRVNGVETNNATKQLADQIRREVNNNNFWVDEKFVFEGTGAENMLEMITNIDRLARENPGKRSSSGKVANADTGVFSPNDNLPLSSPLGQSIRGLTRKNSVVPLKSKTSRKRLDEMDWDDWKGMSLEDDANDTWGFDKWEAPKKTVVRKRAHPNSK